MEGERENKGNTVRKKERNEGGRGERKQEKKTKEGKEEGKGEGRREGKETRREEGKEAGESEKKTAMARPIAKGRKGVWERERREKKREQDGGTNEIEG